VVVLNDDWDLDSQKKGLSDKDRERGEDQKVGMGRNLIQVLNGRQGTLPKSIAFIQSESSFD
jgi:hypothetical protein